MWPTSSPTLSAEYRPIGCVLLPRERSGIRAMFSRKQEGTLPPADLVLGSCWGAMARIPVQDMVEVDRVDTSIDRSRQGVELCVSRSTCEESDEGARCRDTPVSRALRRACLGQCQVLKRCCCKNVTWFTHRNPEVMWHKAQEATPSSCHRGAAAGRVCWCWSDCWNTHNSSHSHIYCATFILLK